MGGPFSAGFWLATPNEIAFREMVSLAQQGKWNDRGWNNSGIGWVYGGSTIMGLVPWWIFKKEPKEAIYEIPRNVYNNQGINPGDRNVTKEMVKVSKMLCF